VRVSRFEVNHPTFLSRLPIRSLEFSWSFGSSFASVDMMEMVVCRTEKWKMGEEKRRGPVVPSLPHAPFSQRGYSNSPAARLRRGGNERSAPRKHSSFSHDLSKRQRDLPPFSHPLEMPEMADLLGRKINFARGTSLPRRMVRFGLREQHN
jgi:hypothetical protein